MTAGGSTPEFDVRHPDELGRVVTPAAVRMLLGLHPHDTLAVSVDELGRVVLTPLDVDQDGQEGRGPTV